jgi:hypothetical protein
MIKLKEIKFNELVLYKFSMIEKKRDHCGLPNAIDNETLRKCIEDTIVKACKLSKNTFQNLFLFLCLKIKIDICKQGHD